MIRICESEDLSIVNIRIPPPPRPSLFPYTTLFRSDAAIPRGLSHATPVYVARAEAAILEDVDGNRCLGASDVDRRDRKSTRLNSSHVSISYAVFCLKKKKKGKVKRVEDTEQQMIID